MISRTCASSCSFASRTRAEMSIAPVALMLMVALRRTQNSGARPGVQPAFGEPGVKGFALVLLTLASISGQLFEIHIPSRENHTYRVQIRRQLKIEHGHSRQRAAWT